MSTAPASAVSPSSIAERRCFSTVFILCECRFPQLYRRKEVFFDGVHTRSICLIRSDVGRIFSSKGPIFQFKGVDAIIGRDQLDSLLRFVCKGGIQRLSISLNHGQTRVHATDNIGGIIHLMRTCNRRMSV